MEETSNLQDWEILSSDSDGANSFTAMDDIIRSDYFSLDPNKLLHQNHPKNSMDSHQMEVPFQADESNFDLGLERTELGAQESEKEGSFLVDDSKMEVGFEGIEKGGSFLVDDPKMEVGIGEVDAIHQNSDENSDLRELREEGNNEKKVLIWWKLPLDILKLCASRVRTVWSVPIAAAFIGILMVVRRLYKMKYKSKRIPFKVTFEDKKAASKLLLRAAHLNEVVVRHMPVIRSPLLPSGGVTQWPAFGQD